MQQRLANTAERMFHMLEGMPAASGREGLQVLLAPGTADLEELQAPSLVLEFIPLQGRVLRRPVLPKSRQGRPRHV
jgi:hypothetical protein